MGHVGLDDIRTGVFSCVCRCGWRPPGCRRRFRTRSAARTVGSNGPSSARPIRNGLLITLKAVEPHAAPARSVASAAAASAAAAAASAAAAAPAGPRPDAAPGPPRFTSTFA